MKQKKKPFLLMTIVVTLVVVMLGVNMSQYLRDPGRIKDIKAPNAETIAKMKERQSEEPLPDGLEVGDMMLASSMGAMGGDAVPVDEVPPVSSIKLPRLQKYQSIYSTDSTTGHWWTEQSKQKQVSDERAAVNKRSRTEG